jgi:hypothetical protein
MMKDSAMELPEIDRLLKADEANVQSMRQYLAGVSDELLGLLNDADALYSTCCRAFGQEVSKSVGPMNPDEGVINQRQAQYIRGLLLAQIGTLYAMIVTDFLRMRVTVPLMNVRLQCESVALLKLMQQNPAVAQDWQAIKTGKQGVAFYRKYQSKLKDALQSYHLDEAYDRCSAVADHSRFIGLARRFTLVTREDGHRRSQLHTILAQEFDKEHPHYFLVEVLFTLRVQARILANIRDAAPEITDPILLETRIPRFLKGVARLDEDWRKQLSRRFTQSKQTGEPSKGGDARTEAQGLQ